jgi:hypothetical protein
LLFCGEEIKTCASYLTFPYYLMSTKRFVSGSSIILMGWLGATFLNEVPCQRYPRLDKKTASVTANDTTDTAAVDPAKSQAPPFSVSR